MVCAVIVRLMPFPQTLSESHERVRVRSTTILAVRRGDQVVIAGDGQVTTTDTHPRGAMLRAYDKVTGKEVGAVWMPAPQSGSPMTYTLNGKQYIVVAVSGGSSSGEYIAFSVPTAPTTTTNSNGRQQGR